ncbi:MAG: triosephosphate isomerase [Dorea sp.]|nr:triosephosphate isomerase [Dorea sp.]
MSKVIDRIDIEMLVRQHLQELGLDGGSAKKKEYIVAANWKMNMTEKETRRFLEEMKGTDIAENIRVMIFPPYPYLYIFKEMLRYERIAYGAQDVAKEENGAYTGEVSAAMLGDMGCPLTLAGHSERRSYYGDTSEIVAKKAKAALEYQITPMICIGETLAERKSGRYKEILKGQLDAVYEGFGDRVSECLIAYEPVWAIGSMFWSSR